jgi:hypothetical protein
MLYIPLMKHLRMSWTDIKNTSRNELTGLLNAYAEHENFHSMDGYTERQVSEMAKDNPQIRAQYTKYLETRRKYEDMQGLKKNLTFKGL